MNFYDVEVLNNWYFKIKLPYLDRQRLSYSQKTLEYVWGLRRYVTKWVKDYLYQDEVNDGEFVFQIGYAEFILNEFDKELTALNKAKLQRVTYSDSVLTTFSNLYPIQNQDLNRLISFKRGIFQCYTGYGKSEVIATLANYLSNELGINVLIVTPSNTSLEEIKLRLYNKFGIELDYFDYERNINAINLNGFLKSSWYDPNNDYWLKDTWILADEVENCVSETAMEFYESIKSISHMYGFSATADKKLGETLSAEFPTDMGPDELMEYKSKLRDALGRNKYLIGYFGTSAVYRTPDDFNITLVDVISTISEDDLQLPAEYAYNEIIYELFTAPKVCNLIEKVAYKVGTIFIPMFRLEVIDYWVDHIFKKKDYLVVVISSRGYELYEQGKFLSSINLQDLKLMVKHGIVGVILGTKSSYNALDLPELKRSFLLYSKTANVVLQAIGRTTRKREFEIYNISPIKTIPTYSKDLIERKSLIKNYYKDCNIKEIRVNENNYGY